MKKLPSIQRRLLGALVVIGLAWGIATSIAVGYVVRHEVEEVLDHGLKESAEIILGVLQFNSASLQPGPDRSLPAPAHDEQLVWQLVNASGTVDLRSHRAPDKALTSQRTEGFSVAGGWRVFAMPFGAQQRMLLVAQDGAERSEARREAVSFTIGAALLVGMAAVLWLRVRTRRELAPLGELAAAVRGHDPLAEASALPAPSREELVPVHAAITELGARLAKRIANEQAFAAHAAHALRTPLATVIANLAVVQRRATQDEDKVFLQRCRDAASRLRRVVTALLTMFRTGSEPQAQPIDLESLVAQLPFESLSMSCESQVAMHGDPDLLAAALMNLFDNAERHGATWVSVRASAHGTTHACIVVSDNGPGIPEPERQGLQAAMDEENYSGRTGLGLMLADLVARAHGGRCTLVATPAGCTVSLTLRQLPGRTDPGLRPDPGEASRL